MTLALLLMAAAAPGGGQAVALATARIVQGERISLSAPARGPDRQLRESRRPAGPNRPQVTIRLIEFQ